MTNDADSQPPHIGDLAERARGGSDPLAWILAEDLADLELPRRLEHDALPGEIARRGIRHPFVDRAIAAGYRVRPAGLAPWMIVYGPSGWRIDVAVAPWDDAGGLGALDRDELRAALDLYRATVGVRYRRSPGATGTDLLRLLRRRRPLGRSAPPEIAADGAIEADIRWIRELDREELRRPWIHAFDANARYLASCSSVELGLGEPEELTPARGVGLGFDKRSPGYHFAEIPLDRLRPLARAVLDPLGSKDPAGDWYTTPTIEIAEELVRGAAALDFRILRSFVWPSHGRLLEPLYRRLRDARAAIGNMPATPASEAALLLVKRTYAHLIGGFAGHWREAGDELYRPDWRHAIIASARVNLYRRVRRLRDPPFAIDVDAVWISSWSSDPALAGRELGLGDGPGAFRPIGSVPMRQLDRSVLSRSWMADLPWRHLRELVEPSPQLELL